MYRNARNVCRFPITALWAHSYIKKQLSKSFTHWSKALITRLNAHYHNKQQQLSTSEIIKQHGEQNICSPGVWQQQLISIKIDV